MRLEDPAADYPQRTTRGGSFCGDAQRCLGGPRARRPAARPGVVVSPEVVASQGSVEHAEGWLLAVPLYLVDCRLTPKQIFVQGMKYNVKVC